MLETPRFITIHSDAKLEELIQSYLKAASETRAKMKNALCLAAVEVLKEDILNYALVEEHNGTTIKWYFKKK